METNDVKEYEISFLAKEEGGRDAVGNLVRRHGGEIFVEGPFERIMLAYPIEKETSAHFGFFHVRLAPAAIAPLDAALRSASGILRHLIVTPPFARPKPRMAPRPLREEAPASPAREVRPAQPESLPLSNEALEKKIEEILKQ